MSELLAIHNALADQDIVMDDGETIRGWRLDNVKAKVSSDHLPIRLILPPGAGTGSAVENYEPLTYKTGQVTWRLTDLMLYQVVGRGGGISNVWSHLTDYIAQYVATFNTNRMLGTGKVSGFLPEAAVYEWPEGSEMWFHGVRMILLIQETIC